MLLFGGNTVYGRFVANTPEFVDVSTSTTQVQLCSSGMLTFTANLVPPTTSATRLPAAGQAVRVQR